MSSDEENSAKKASNKEVLTGVIVSIASVAAGTAIAWSSPVNPKLSEDTLHDTPLDRVATEIEKSWIGSLVALGAFITPFIAGPLSDKIGRKWTLLSSAIFFILSFILLLTTRSVTQIYIARLIQGFGVGFVMTVQPMYIGEIASDAVRGALGSLMQLFITVGILYVYVIGPYNTYYELQWACLAIPIVFFATFFFMPESPNYLISRGRKDDATKALVFLRGKKPEEVQEEISVLEKNIQLAMEKAGSYVDVFRGKANTKALTISVGLCVFQQLSGINAVLFYTQDIFLKAVGKSGESTHGAPDSALSTIIVGAVMMGASGVTPLIVDRLGRKVLLLFSAAGIVVALGFLGLFFMLDAHNYEIVQSLGWLPVTALIVFVIVYCFGFGPLPWAVMGEMFSAEIKSKASAVVAGSCWFLGFCVTLGFEPLDTALGTHWAFWLFGICSAGGFIFVLLIVFETKGLTSQQIQDKLNGL
ncbi:facilitated trehalose transporter Tret1-like [Culicoides brevitarsis]|uniref:facilitated trehalose transporter Tret1-like n=1 Tax=Culicoides brevitarsis TaxID=469753 RepID=UPI00307CA0DA